MDGKIEKYLAFIGMKFPENTSELLLFEEGHQDFQYELDESVVDPYKILESFNKKNVTTKTKLITIQKTNALTKQQNYFMRAVLAAEIAFQMYNEPTFGNVKFQKLVYLCEQVSKMNFATNYSKQVAGPFDHKFMHTIGNEFKKQKWFNVLKVKEGQYYKVKYTPLENINAYKDYYQSYFGAIDNEIQHLLETFRKSYTNEVELVATIFACLNEAIIEKTIITDDLIIRRVHDWAKEKHKFTSHEISAKMRWMNEAGIYPSEI